MPATAIKPINERAYPVYKYRELLASLGNDQEIRSLILSYGFEAPTLPVIKGWRVRNSIPTKWLPLLMHKAMKDGALYDMTKLLKAPF
jgi:hypothetical protein